MGKTYHEDKVVKDDEEEGANVPPQDFCVPYVLKPHVSKLRETLDRRLDELPPGEGLLLLWSVEFISGCVNPPPRPCGKTLS